MGERDKEEHSAESSDEGCADHHFSSALRVCAEVAGEVHALPKATECSRVPRTRKSTRGGEDEGEGDKEGGRGGEKGTRDADVFIVSARVSHLKGSGTHLNTTTDHWNTVRTAVHDSA